MSVILTFLIGIILLALFGLGNLGTVALFDKDHKDGCLAIGFFYVCSYCSITNCLWNKSVHVIKTLSLFQWSIVTESWLKDKMNFEDFHETLI
jgi:hypothetical protein